MFLIFEINQLLLKYIKHKMLLQVKNRFLKIGGRKYPKLHLPI